MSKLQAWPTDCKNPYLETFLRTPLTWDRQFAVRNELTCLYAWAIPNDAAIRRCVACSPIVEMGAGVGYWAKLISAAGGDVIAYDKAPKRGDNYYHGKGEMPEWMEDVTWFDVQLGEPSTLVSHPDRTLLLCWPPYDNAFARQCLDTYGGNTLIYIGEGDGGCTADYEFFYRLDVGWQLLEMIEIPRWLGIHDAMFVYQRKETR